MGRPKSVGHKPLTQADNHTFQPKPAMRSLEAVGGLSEVLAELCDLVALPLKRPDLLEKLGLEPTRGVLLIGPPGTGKTLTARALAAELGVNYIALDLQLKVDLSDITSRLEILQVHNRDRPLAEDVNLAAWAVRTEGWNGAELALLSNQATLQAIRRYRIQGFTNPTVASIIAADFETAYQSLLELRYSPENQAAILKN